MTKGCLVIHGLSGTPATVGVLQEALLSKGYRIAAPCLAGHGGSTEDLSKTTWRDWYSTVRIAFQTLRKEVDRVYYAGISLGALLGLKLALDEGWGVRALALLSTPLKLTISETIALHAVRNSPLRWIIKKIPRDLKRSVADPEGRRLYDDLSLRMVPSASIFEVADLQSHLLESLRKISNPIILLHAKDDIVAPLLNIDIVKKGVSSDIVESVIFGKSRHVITMDYEKNLVAMSVVDFFGRFA